MLSKAKEQDRISLSMPLKERWKHAIYSRFEPALCIAVLELLVFLIKIRFRHNAKKAIEKLRLTHEAFQINIKLF